MPKASHPVQPLRPTTPAQWFCATFHRHPVTFIPHWDAIEPVEGPVIEVEATWRDLADQIDRMAAAGALDDAHGDLVDRLVAPIAEGWRIDVRQIQEQQRILSLLEEQGEAHLARLGHRIAALRRDLEQLTDLYTSTWDSLVGRPAGTSAAPPQPRTLPAPIGRPDVPATSPAPEPPSLHRAA